MSLSLVEKLALTGAFLGLVAMVVGTDEDPGLVAEQAEVLAARAGDRSPQPLPASGQPSPRDAAIPSPAPAAMAVDANEGAGFAPPTVSPAMPTAQPSSPPDDEANQLDMRKVIAAQH